MQDKLLFLIGPPRSGSTLLTRMLGSHSAIHAPDEPHLLTPLAHLGYYARVDQAPYDPIITQLAMQELVKALPDGEAGFLAALRACTDSLYGAAARAERTAAAARQDAGLRARARLRREALPECPLPRADPPPHGGLVLVRGVVLRRRPRGRPPPPAPARALRAGHRALPARSAGPDPPRPLRGRWWATPRTRWRAFASSPAWPSSRT